MQQPAKPVTPSHIEPVRCINSIRSGHALILMQQAAETVAAGARARGCAPGVNPETVGYVSDLPQNSMLKPTLIRRPRWMFDTWPYAGPNWEFRPRMVEAFNAL